MTVAHYLQKTLTVFIVWKLQLPHGWTAFIQFYVKYIVIFLKGSVDTYMSPGGHSSGGRTIDS